MGQGEIADLVQKQGPAIGQRGAPQTVLHRTREGALDVAEQLRFHQLLGNCPTVHRNEGPVGARGRPVNGLCDQLLASAALATDHHRGLRPRKLADERPQPLHGRTAAEQVGADAVACRGGFEQLRAQPRKTGGMCEHAADDVGGLGDRGGEEVVASGCHRFHELGMAMVVFIEHRDPQQVGPGPRGPLQPGRGPAVDLLRRHRDPEAGILAAGPQQGAIVDQFAGPIRQ